MASRSDRPHALLTGCHGLTGRYIAAELETASYEVVGLAHDGDPLMESVLCVNVSDHSLDFNGMVVNATISRMTKH